MATKTLKAPRTILAASLAIYAVTVAFGALGVFRPDFGLAIGIVCTLLVGFSAMACIAIQMREWLLTSRRH